MLFTMLRFLFIATVFINTVFYRGAKEEEEGGGWNINRAQWRAAPSAHRQPLLFLCSSFSPSPSPFLLFSSSSSVFSTVHVNSGEQLTTSLRLFHCQSLLFLFPFSFSFVFCIHHCPKKKTRNRAQWTVTPSTHHRPSPFPPPATPLSLPIPLLLHLRLLHALLFT